MAEMAPGTLYKGSVCLGVGCCEIYRGAPCAGARRPRRRGWHQRAPLRPAARGPARCRARCARCRRSAAAARPPLSTPPTAWPAARPAKLVGFSRLTRVEGLKNVHKNPTIRPYKSTSVCRLTPRTRPCLPTSLPSYPSTTVTDAHLRMALHAQHAPALPHQLAHDCCQVSAACTRPIPSHLSSQSISVTATAFPLSACGKHHDIVANSCTFPGQCREGAVHPLSPRT